MAHIESQYLDPEDDMDSTALSSIYTNPGQNAPSPIGQNSQYPRTQSSINNNLLQSQTDFTDIHTLSSTDDGNWDETQQYKHDLPSHCARYKSHVAVMSFGVLFVLAAVILFIVGIAIHSPVMMIVFPVLAAIAGVADGYQIYQFWQSYQKRIPFEFTNCFKAAAERNQDRQ